MTDDAIREVLKTAKTIAVVGLSSDPFRPSHSIAQYLQQQGYHIIPVNPNETEVLGERAVARLEDIPQPVDIVNVFRRSEFVPDVVQQAITKGTRCIWMQQGVFHPAAAAQAEAAGIGVVMDLCILQEYRRLVLRKG